MTTKTYYVYFLAKETNDLIHFVEDLKNTVVLMLPCLLFIVHCPTAKGYADCHTSDIGHWFAMTLNFYYSRVIFPNSTLHSPNSTLSCKSGRADANLRQCITALKRLEKMRGCVIMNY